MRGCVKPGRPSSPRSARPASMICFLRSSTLGFVVTASRVVLPEVRPRSHDEHDDRVGEKRAADDEAQEYVADGGDAGIQSRPEGEEAYRNKEKHRCKQSRREPP